MLKKIYPVILTLLLIYFSFYYTNKVVGLIKSKDPIMVKIEKEKDSYEVKAINAKADSKNVIPGKNGKVVNVNESFKKMKSYGEYNEELYVFDEIEPTVSMDDYYDRYINLGRNDSNKVSLVFKVGKNDSIDEVLKILKDNNVPATLFVDGLFINDNSEVITDAIKNGNQVEVLSYDGDYDKLYFEDSLHKLFNITKQTPKFCYADYDRKEVLLLCDRLGLHTIIPTINSSINSFSLVRDKLQSGSIISLKASSNNLNTIINYIKQRGYNLVTLDDLLLEELEK